jgi:hypothetical protein
LEFVLIWALPTSNSFTKNTLTRKKKSNQVLSQLHPMEVWACGAILGLAVIGGGADC